ncbi:MAG: SAM-dependent methyltransferase [Lachnospiraceae bacterium]|nr:SAM-dependent methyltransferase [Lachnospiraceae bacterium]
MDNIISIIEKAYDDEILKASISAPFKKSNVYFKINISAIEIKGERALQFSRYFENKVTHVNTFSKDEAMEEIKLILSEGYKQWDIYTQKEGFKLIMNKKYNFKRLPLDLKGKSYEVQSHNKEKNYIMQEGEPLPMLIELGIMNKEGYILKDKQKKFRQLNKFLEIIKDTADKIPEGAEILDFGCGKSYLTFALYYYLNVVCEKNVKITGLDLKKDVIEFCNGLAQKCGYSGLQFIWGDIMDYESPKKAHMLITLHACDTATDYALAYGVKSGIEVILSVPCCQHELFNQVSNESLNVVLKHGILKERFSAILTDGLRGSLLEAMGYKVNIMEFIESEHTPKNIMIKAVKTKGIKKEEKLSEYLSAAEQFQVKPKLFELLEEYTYDKLYQVFKSGRVS